MKKIVWKYQDIIIYFIVGCLSTFVNLLSYAFYRLFIPSYLINIVLSWLTSLVFAFFMNRKYVFKSKNNKIKQEFLSFTISRLLTLGMEILFMYLLVDLIQINDLIAKVIVQFLVFLANYLFGKFIVFKKE